jgi:glycerol uptake facilitator-like aquaporin
MEGFDLARRLTAEALGTALLVAAVIGSGIMADRLSGGNDALALLCNTVATGAILVVIITIFAPVSGAHFNPAVSLVMMIRGELDRRDGLLYILVQIVGGCLGALFAHLMFGLDPIQIATTARTGLPQWFAEFVATLRAPDHHTWVHPLQARRGRICRRPLHHLGLLVHGVDVLCQSRGDHRAIAERYLCRHRAC